MTKELTIIGATGHLSTRMVRQLKAHDIRLKIIARNPDRARTLLGGDLLVVPGDVEDPASLREALQGSQAVYVHLNTESMDPSLSFYTEREGVQNIVEAAELSGVTHLIQIAGIESLRPDFFRSGIIATEQIRRVGMEAIRKSRIPHTFMTCSFFLDSLPRYVSEGTFAIFGAAANQIHFTNTDQLAEHLFHVAGNPEAFGKSLPVQGIEGLDFPSAAQRFFSTYDPEIQVERLPMNAIDSFGLPAEDAAFLKHVWEVTSGFHEEFIASDVHSEFGAPTLTVEEFAAKLRAELSHEDS